MAAQAYDTIALEYAARKFSSQAADWSSRLLAWVQDELPAGALVLDGGCGHGLELQALSAAGLKPVGVDVSAEMLRVARGTAPAARLLQADLTRLPLASASLDGVWSLHALLHVLDLDRALSEVARVLRSGAPAALTFAVGDGVTDEPVSYATEVSRTFVHWHEERVRQALACAALTVKQWGIDDDGRTTLWVRARRG